MMCDERLFASQISAFENEYEIVVSRIDKPASNEAMARRILDEVKDPTLNLMDLAIGRFEP